MHAFTRLTNFLLFVLSLSFLTCALPTPAISNGIDLAARGDSADAVISALVDVKAKVDARVAAMGRLAFCRFSFA